MQYDPSTIQKTGSLRQLAGTRHCTLASGGTNGTRVIDVNTGGGLQYTIVSDRGLDISSATFRGINLTYLSPQEEMNAAFYNSYRNEWLRTFFGGLLTTCGPVNFGPCCQDGENEYGIHGRFNVTPSVNVCDATDIENGVISVSGTIANYVMFGEKIEIKRVISSAVGENSIRIKDIVTNRSDAEIPNMMLYHINFGFPLLDVDSTISVNSAARVGYDEYSRQCIADIGTFAPPNPGNREKNYLHTMHKSRPGIAGIRNERLGFGVEIRFDTGALPFLTQWKNERARDYVLALEPCNAPCESLSSLRERQALPFLGAGHAALNELEIAVV